MTPKETKELTLSFLSSDFYRFVFEPYMKDTAFELLENSDDLLLKGSPARTTLIMTGKRQMLRQIADDLKTWSSRID